MAVVTEEDIAWFHAEAERMGLTPKQLAEIAAQGWADAIEEGIARWQREQEQEVAA